MWPWFIAERPRDQGRSRNNGKTPPLPQCPLDRLVPATSMAISASHLSDIVATWDTA